MKTLEERRKEFEKLFIEDECIVSAMRYFIDDDTSQAVKEYDKIKKGQKKLWQWFKLQMEEESREAELKGVGKILDSLWTASIPLLGEKASKRIKEEMVYYFGKNWAVVMYKFIGQKGNRHKPVKTLDQITLKNSKEGR